MDKIDYDDLAIVCKAKDKKIKQLQKDLDKTSHKADEIKRLIKLVIEAYSLEEW